MAAQAGAMDGRASSWMESWHGDSVLSREIDVYRNRSTKGRVDGKNAACSHGTAVRAPITGLKTAYHASSPVEWNRIDGIPAVLDGAFHTIWSVGPYGRLWWPSF